VRDAGAGTRSSRRAFLRRGLVSALGVGCARSLAWAQRQQELQSITAGHALSTFVYGQHLVAAAKGFFEAEGLRTPDFVVPGDGAKVVQALAAGQIQFADRVVALAYVDDLHPRC